MKRVFPLHNITCVIKRWRTINNEANRSLCTLLVSTQQVVHNNPSKQLVFLLFLINI